MPQWMQDLISGWPMIRANLPTFFVILVLIVGTVWFVMNYIYSERIANRDGIISNRDSEIALLKGQRDDYKDKLSGATPDQAKARIDALEARLARVEPRQLSENQRAILAKNLQHTGVFKISLVSEMGTESQQYAQEFAAVFRQVGNWSLSEGAVMGIGTRPRSGIGVQFPNIAQPSAEAAILMNALRAANIPFDIVPQPAPDGSPAGLLICVPART